MAKKTKSANKAAGNGRRKGQGQADITVSKTVVRDTSISLSDAQAAVKSCLNGKSKWRIINLVADWEPFASGDRASIAVYGWLGTSSPGSADDVLDTLQCTFHPANVKGASHQAKGHAEWGSKDTVLGGAQVVVKGVAANSNTEIGRLRVRAWVQKDGVAPLN
nr:MAG: hypothetical protein 2 [Barnaviridae sp.]